MTSSLRRQKNIRTVLFNRLLIIVLGMSLPITMATPAQAGWRGVRDNIVSFLGGQTSGSASGNYKGGATRDTSCQVPNPSEVINPIDFNELQLSDLFIEDAAKNSIRNYASLSSTRNKSADVSSSRPYPFLIALVPFKHEIGAEARETLLVGKTVSSHPEWILYVPFSTTGDTAVLELSIADSKTGDYLLERWPLSVDQPFTSDGWFSIQLPIESLPNGLEPGPIYHWTVALSCESSGAPRTLQEASGLIMREADADLTWLSTADYSDYLDRDIWYEAVTHLRQDSEQWSNFLTAYFELINTDLEDGRLTLNDELMPWIE